MFLMMTIMMTAMTTMMAGDSVNDDNNGALIAMKTMTVTMTTMLVVRTMTVRTRSPLNRDKITHRKCTV